MEDPTIPFPKLPNDLIVEILTWLPVKPLLKFRCVCKSWRTLISSKQFVKDHLKNTKSDRNFTSRRLIMESRGTFKQCSASSVLYKPDSEAFDMSCPFQTRGEVRFVGSCNGLICLSIDSEDLILWNPSTRIWKKLPGLDLSPEVSDHVDYGFGFDKSSDDYKLIVRFYRNPDLTGNVMQVYSLRNDEWKMVKNFLNDHWMMMRNATFVDGKVYWIAYTLYGSGDLLLIVCFDLEKEEGEILELPNHLRSFKFATLGAFEGSLFVLFSDPTSANVWKMDGCRVGDGKWTKVATMPDSANGIGDYSYKRVLYVKNSRVLFMIILDQKHTFVTFDAKDCSISYPEVRTKWSRLQKFFTNDWFQLGTYLESLVSPLLIDE